jgi:dephospho-CoA kinase
MLIVGLTGGIASGKSTVARMFSEEGGYVVDTDMISREVVTPGKRGWQEVVNFFSRDILNSDGTLNRKKLGDIVFSNPEKRKKLEEILHPKIYEEQTKKIREILKRNNRAIVIVDVPLLIEVNKHKSFDRVILVYVSPQIQIERLMKRDGLSLGDAHRRISSQMSIDSKVKYAHYVINNEGSLKKTRERVKEVFQRLKEAEAKKIQKGEKGLII